MRKNKQNSTFSFKYIVIATAIIISATQLGWIYHDEDPQYVSIRVRTGDTVWNIASAATDSKTDIRDVVDGILTKNNLSNKDDIYPNQILRIPVKTGSIDTVKEQLDVI